jgi:hypothetical protein
MKRSKPDRDERNAGAFLGPDILVPVPMGTLGDDYHDEPAEPENSDRVPEPEPPGLVRRVLGRLGRPAAGPAFGPPQANGDPVGSHPYKETDDPGIVPAASGTGWHQGDQARMLAVTTAALRGTRCAMPGCGMERHDPIHTPADD